MTPFKQLNLAAVVLVQLTDGAWLAVSRKEDERKWGLPGGKANGGESSATAAQRELWEETQISCRTRDLVPVYSGPCLTGNVTYWVTTYLLLNSAIQFENLRAEPKYRLGIVSQQALCDPQCCDFAEYNTKVFRQLQKLVLP